MIKVRLIEISSENYALTIEPLSIILALIGIFIGLISVLLAIYLGWEKIKNGYNDTKNGLKKIKGILFEKSFSFSQKVRSIFKLCILYIPKKRISMNEIEIKTIRKITDRFQPHMIIVYYFIEIITILGLIGGGLASARASNFSAKWTGIWYQISEVLWLLLCIWFMLKAWQVFVRLIVINFEVWMDAKRAIDIREAKINKIRAKYNIEP